MRMEEEKMYIKSRMVLEGGGLFKKILFFILQFYRLKNFPFYSPPTVFPTLLEQHNIASATVTRPLFFHWAFIPFPMLLSTILYLLVLANKMFKYLK